MGGYTEIEAARVLLACNYYFKDFNKRCNENLKLDICFNDEIMREKTSAEYTFLKDLQVTSEKIVEFNPSARIKIDLKTMSVLGRYMG